MVYNAAVERTFRARTGPRTIAWSLRYGDASRTRAESTAVLPAQRHSSAHDLSRRTRTRSRESCSRHAVLLTVTTRNPAIRPAHAGDAAALAALAERTFRATFGPDNTVANLDLHCARTYGEAIQAAEIADPRRVTVVVDVDGALVGYAQLRWGRAPACVVAARPAEIQRVYVDAPWHGRGVAQALMEAMLAHARAGGADRVWLGVWERNARARAFYTKSGFVEAGDHAFVLGDEAQRDLVMVREP